LVTPATVPYPGPDSVYISIFFFNSGSILMLAHRLYVLVLEDSVEIPTRSSL